VVSKLIRRISKAPSPINKSRLDTTIEESEDEIVQINSAHFNGNKADSTAYEHEV
jgi:hypothetical protein